MPGDPTQLPFITLFSGIVIFILIMLVPAFLELRNPKDPGPRRIEGKAAPSKYQLLLVSMEENEKTEANLDVIRKVSRILSILPNLET